MSAPDFYFAVNALFRYLHDTYGRAELERYWQDLGHEYYGPRTARWREGGPSAIALDWKDYFDHEPGAEVIVDHDDTSVDLTINTCPAIKHLRSHNREIVPYFCDHCDHVCGAVAQDAGYRFERTGGNGSCRQRFVQLAIKR